MLENIFTMKYSINFDFYQLLFFNYQNKVLLSQPEEGPGFCVTVNEIRRGVWRPYADGFLVLLKLFRMQL